MTPCLSAEKKLDIKPCYDAGNSSDFAVDNFHIKIIVFSGDYSPIYANGYRPETMNAKPAIAALLMTAMLFASPAVIADERTAQENIPANAAGTGIHDSLVAALDRADLIDTLSGDGPFTVFAPTDDAFTAAGIDLDSFNTDDEIAALVDILTYHVLAGAVNSTQVTDGMSATMLNGDEVTFSVTDGTVMIGDATVTIADVTASNGIIHVIDMVLMPPSDLVDIPTVAQGTGIHDSLVAAVIQAELLTTLQGEGPFTVFAPTDDAFAAAGIDLTALDNDEGKATLTDILLYHVVSGSVASSALTNGMTATAVNGDDLTFTVGEGVMVNDANVILADVEASNGLVHVIDKVLMPPVDLVDIPTVAQGTGIHDSLVAAVIQANLLSTLQGQGPFTVFAPTDDAFTAAGIDLDALNSEEGMATLTDILLYHVVSGAVPSSAVTDGLVAAAVNGDDLTFTVGEGVMVNDANVILADVQASNGLIHVIDKVLMPPVPVTEADGDICYNMYTHTIAAGASFDECMAHAYYENYEMNGQTFTGCYNLATHTLTMVSQEECEAYMWTPAVDIAMTAQATTIHNSLVAALAQAELVATLQGDGPFTVFAPTDDAFAEAGIDLAALDNEEGKALLTDILLYHVVSGAVPSSAVTDGMVAAAVNGDDLTFSVGEGVMVNDANVVLADVPASNGVIHVIDKVMMPPADTVDTSECDVIIGIDDTGLAYDKPYVEVDVGATVCWIWNDESMAHNVAQIAKEGDTTRYMGGVYSGESMTTVDYRYTFAVDQTFNYICEPHATSGMAGQIVVGEGSIVEPEVESNNTPGFSAGIAALAVIGALMIAGRRLR